MTRHVLIAGVAALLLLAPVAGQAAEGDVSAEQILTAVDKMTPEQVRQLGKSLFAKLHEKDGAENECPAMGISLAGCMASLDSVQLPFAPSTGQELDLSSPNGWQLDLLWRGCIPRLRWGFRAAGFSAQDADRSDAGDYSRAKLEANEQKLLLNYEFIRAKRCLAWLEAAGGRGNIEIESIDTPAGSATTLREHNGNYWVGDVRVGVAWRCRPNLSVILSGGYRLAESTMLREAAEDTEAAIDMSGPAGSVGVACNF